MEVFARLSSSGEERDLLVYEHDTCSKVLERIALVFSMKASEIEIDGDLPPLVAGDVIQVRASKKAVARQKLLDMEISPNNASLDRYARLGRADVVCLLLDYGLPITGDVTTSKPKGLTPLHQAAISSSIPTVEAILAYRPDMNCRSAKGNTALHLASQVGNLEMVEFLMSQGFRVEEPGEMETWISFGW
eukprot:TRINITY_DN17975_c0_g2_i1.p1 TRINITY_DN17975_c0_g2~~TRINITY_DN17975_c0_g2_i1.p1  ORF type:complete len:204 (+),score=24.77 TRINITY_DN17975_c0_g2_i1:44-613(+)